MEFIFICIGVIGFGYFVLKADIINRIQTPQIKELEQKIEQLTQNVEQLEQSVKTLKKEITRQ